MGQRICSVEGCESPVRVKSRGWCSKHYQRWWKHGDPLAGVTEGCSVENCANPHAARGLCQQHYSRERYAENRDELLAQQRNYRERNRERKSAQDRAYREKNRDRVREAQRAYYKRNSAMIRERIKVRAAQTYASAKAEGRCAWMHGTGCTDPAVEGFTRCARHRALQGEYNYRYTNGVYDKSYTQRGIAGCCWLCGGAFTADDPRQHDHLIPSSRGGSDEPWNMAPAHRSCNIRRSATPLGETVDRFHPNGLPPHLRPVIAKALAKH